MARRLRSGYTTGACAAAAAKAAVMFAGSGTAPEQVEIPFPDGSRHAFSVHRSWQQPSQEEGKSQPAGKFGELGSDTNLGQQPAATGFAASVIKDAGDDPDVTNGAEIVALVEPAAKFESLTGCGQDCVELEDRDSDPPPKA